MCYSPDRHSPLVPGETNMARVREPGTGPASLLLERTHLDLPWGRLNVWRSGAGPPVVALHGLGGSGRYWAGLVPLVRGDRSLAFPDLAGFGLSDKPRLRYHRHFHLENLEALIDSLGSLEPVVIVGHSVGGVLAALWAARHPGRVGALALISVPYPNPLLVPGAARRLAEGPPDTRGRVVGGVFRLLWPAAHLLTRATGRFPPEVVGDFGRQSLGARADTMRTLLGDLTIELELGGLRGLPVSVPSLILASEDDRHVDGTAVAKWHQLLPHAELSILPDGGHQHLIRAGFQPLADWINALPPGRAD